MRVPQVSERIKEAPAQALRGVFAGIGQLLLITDKLRNKTPADQDVPRARTPEASADGHRHPPGWPARPDGARLPLRPLPASRGRASHVRWPAAAAQPRRPQPRRPRRMRPRRGARRRVGTAKPATARRPRPSRRRQADDRQPAAKPATARRAAKTAPAEPAAAEPPKPPKRQSPRDFDKTGNVRLLGDEEGGSALSATAPPARPSRPPTAEPVTAHDVRPSPLRRPGPSPPPDRPSRSPPPAPLSPSAPPSPRAGRRIPSRRCPTTTSCPWRRCARGCATSTSRRSGSLRTTSGRTRPAPTCWPCSSAGSPSWRPKLSGARHVG